MATYDSNTIIKSAEDRTVVGLMTGDDESAYREDLEVSCLMFLYSNTLLLIIALLVL